MPENKTILQAIEARIAELRAVEYPTEAQMEELHNSRIAASVIKGWSDRITEDAENATITAERTVRVENTEYVVVGIMRPLATDECTDNNTHVYTASVERRTIGPGGECISRGNIIGEDGELLDGPMGQSELNSLVAELADGYANPTED